MFSSIYTKLNVTRRIRNKYTKKNIVKSVVGGLIKKNLLVWVLSLSLPTIIVIFIIGNSLSFLLFYFVWNKAQEVVVNAEEALKSGAESILDIYMNDLRNKGIDVRPEDIVYDLSDEKDEFNNNVGGSRKDYSNTKERAEMVEGTTIMHQVHNAIVDAVSRYNTDIPGYTYTYVIGSNLTESGGLKGVKWVPWIPVPPEALSTGKVNLKSWSYKDTLEWKSKVGFNMSIMAGDSYNGPFQTDYGSWNSKMGIPQKGWSDSQWDKFIKGSDLRNDGNNDGIADIFNYYDALKNNANYFSDKYKVLRNYQLKTEEGKDDMVTMMVASRYVGIMARGGSKDIKGYGNEWDIWDYEYIEGKNPHIDLMRSAYNEWKNNGPIYREYKQFMEGQSTTTSNGTKSKEIIDKLYIQNGWTKKGNGFQKSYPDGSGYIYILGPSVGNPQDVYYPFRVYWGGKIAEENIREKLLQSNS